MPTNDYYAIQYLIDMNRGECLIVAVSLVIIVQYALIMRALHARLLCAHYARIMRVTN